MFFKNEKSNALIEEMKNHAALAENNEAASGLPVSDQPAVLNNYHDWEPRAHKLLKTLENKYKEFFQVGDSLTEKMDIVSDMIEGMLSNLDKDVVNKMKDDGLAFAQFMQSIMESARNLCQQNDPLPKVSPETQNLSMMSLVDISKTFVHLREAFVNPKHNEQFKTRAIQCVLLTMALGKLQKSEDILNNVDKDVFKSTHELLIAPLQRLSQLKTFAADTKKIFTKLIKCNNITEKDQDTVKNIITILEELHGRSEAIGLITNAIQNAVDLMAMDTLENRFSTAATNQLDIFTKLVEKYVVITMEKQYSKEFSEQILNQLNTDFFNILTMKSATYYRKLSSLIERSQLESDSIQNVKISFKKELCALHEDSYLSDQHKLWKMKAATYTIVEKLKDTRSFFFFSLERSNFEGLLEDFLHKEINTVQNHVNPTLK